MNFHLLLVSLIFAFITPVFSNIPDREINVWVYAPSANATVWQSWYTSFETHQGNITGFSPCSYLMDSNGSLTYQVPDPVLATNWSSHITQTLGLKAYPLIAANGGGMNRAIANRTLGTLFIQATVQEALLYHYSGYNIQIEEPGNSTIEQEWKDYLIEWLTIYQQYNLTLSIITGSICKGKDWMDMECGDYRALHANYSNLFVIPEATYEAYPPDWKEYAQDLVNGLGSTVHFGMVVSKPPIMNPLNGCLPQIINSGVKSLYFWVNPPADNDATWDGFGYFLTTENTTTTTTIV